MFITRPISAGFIIASVLLLLLLSLPTLRRRREEVFAEEGEGGPKERGTKLAEETR